MTCQIQRLSLHRSSIHSTGLTFASNIVFLPYSRTFRRNHSYAITIPIHPRTPSKAFFFQFYRSSRLWDIITIQTEHDSEWFFINCFIHFFQKDSFVLKCCTKDRTDLLSSSISNAAWSLRVVDAPGFFVASMSCWKQFSFRKLTSHIS